MTKAFEDQARNDKSSPYNEQDRPDKPSHQKPQKALHRAAPKCRVSQFVKVSEEDSP